MVAQSVKWLATGFDVRASIPDIGKDFVSVAASRSASTEFLSVQ